MVKKAGALKERIGGIKFSGIFDYEKLYLGIYDWLKDHYYDTSETYKHKMTPSGAEVELKYTAERKESEFLKYSVVVELKLWGLQDIEVVKEGKKQKLNKARGSVEIFMTVTLDYNSEFDKSEFFIRLFNLLRFTVLKDQIMMKWAGSLYYECYKLQTKIKEILGLYTAYNAY